MSLAGISVVIGLLWLAFSTMPYGMAIIAVLVWLYVLG